VDRHQIRAHDALHRWERITQRLVQGWTAPLGYFEMSRALLKGSYAPKQWFADSLALWLSTSSALLGCGIDSDEGLIFALDAAAESAGPRYTALPEWACQKWARTKGASLHTGEVGSRKWRCGATLH
jgi:hypothetical protein